MWHSELTGIRARGKDSDNSVTKLDRYGPDTTIKKYVMILRGGMLNEKDSLC